MACNKEIAEHRAEITKLENQIEALVPWLELDVPMNLKGTGKTELLLGTCRERRELSTVYEKIAENCPETEGVDVQIIHKDQDATYLAVLCLKTDAAAVEEALRAAGFARPSQATDAVPAKKTAELKEQIEQLNTKIGEIEEEIKACAGRQGRLKSSRRLFPDAGKEIRSPSVHFPSPSGHCDQRIYSEESGAGCGESHR